MRARMALIFYKQNVIVREISLKDKPEIFLKTSPKGTVPVLVLPDGSVIEESLEIMVFAYQQQRDDLPSTLLNHSLITQCDSEFAPALKRYKYFERYPDASQQTYFESCLPFVKTLDESLRKQVFLNGDKPSLVDMAIFPFVRQFRKVDEARFNALPWVRVKVWCDEWLVHRVFLQAMTKFPLWDEHSNKPCYLLEPC